MKTENNLFKLILTNKNIVSCNQHDLGSHANADHVIKLLSIQVFGFVKIEECCN